ncbi:ribonuclease H-like domain-containing protein [Tanacetum coccineum]
MGSLKYFLGIEVLENKNGLCLFKRKYCLELLCDYDLLACKPATTPMQQNGNRYFLCSSLFVLAYALTFVVSLDCWVESVEVFENVTRCSKKQATLSRSSAEAKYRCMTSTTCEVIWLTHLLKDLNVEGLLPVSLYCDSTSAIQIATNPVFHEKTKHFEIDVHLVREKVASGVISTVKVNSANQLADIFTKILNISQHKQFCDNLNMVDIFEV